MNELDQNLKQIACLPANIQQIHLAALLTKMFSEKKVSLTIVGGAAVQYYTNAEYTTKDLDVILYGDTKQIIESIMFTLGFKRTSMYRHFEHPLFNFVVEFPPSPVEVGGRYIRDLAHIEVNELMVRIIKVEDLIMDRIIAGVEWRSADSIRQAKLLWLKNKEDIDYPYLEDFAKSEGYLNTLHEIVGKKKSINKSKAKINSMLK